MNRTRVASAAAAFTVAVTGGVAAATSSDNPPDRLTKLEQDVEALDARVSRLEGTNTPTGTPTSTTPASQIDLKNWKLQLPVDASGGVTPGCKPAEIQQPQLGSYSSEWFVRGADGSLTFKSPAKGCTTKNSPRARSELREMNADGSNAAWDSSTGQHVLKLRQAITHMPTTSPRMITAQVHDGKTSAFALKADSRKGSGPGKVALCYELSGKAAGCLDTGYVPGTSYDLEIVVSAGRVRVLYNGTQKVDAALRSVTAANYFKAGAYPMSRVSEPAGEYGEVVIRALTVSHGNGSEPTSTPTSTQTPTSTSSPTQTATATVTSTPTATGTTPAGQTYFITGYSYWDNTPPGSAAISHPVIHKTAAGTGTHADPITVAVGHTITGGRDVLDIPAGTRFYLVQHRRYLIVEDSCGDGPTPQNGPCHVLPQQYRGKAVAWLDAWVDGKAAGRASSDKCMDRLTGLTQVIKDPPAGLPVTAGPLC